MAAPSTGGTGQVETGPLNAPAALPPKTRANASSTGWSVGRIASVVSGSLLVLLSLVLLGGGGTGLWADLTQREAGFATTGVHRFSTAGSALTTEETHLGSAGFGWLYSPRLLGKVRIRVTPVSRGSALFVGIGRSADVDRYLAGVSHTVISDFFGDKAQALEGGSVTSPPGAQGFWVASAAGAGKQSIEWQPKKGSWTVVAMHADGRRGLAVGAELGAKFPALLWIALGLLGAGAVFLVGGGLLIVGAFRQTGPPVLEQ